MRKIMMIVVLCVATCTLWAQNDVSLVVSGEGKDKEEATLKALRSAIEQAYGTFVSANTTVLNDQLVADEIVSLSSGNIQKYEYVSENKMPNGNTFVTLSATVSIDKLVSFAESKGMEAELKGSLFAMNIKKMEFDKKAEEKAVENLCKQLETMLPSMFDYVIEVGNPTINQENSDWCDVEIYVGVVSTDAFYSFCSILCNTMFQIALNKSEKENYQKVNAKIYETHVLDGPLYYTCNKKIKKYNLMLFPDRDMKVFELYNLTDSTTAVGSAKDTFAYYAVERIYETDFLDRSNIEVPTYLSLNSLNYKGYSTVNFYPLLFRSDITEEMIHNLYSKLYSYAYNCLLEDGFHEIEFYIDTESKNLEPKLRNGQNLEHLVKISELSHLARCKDKDAPMNPQERPYCGDYNERGVTTILERWNRLGSNDASTPAAHTPYLIYGSGFIENNRFCAIRATLYYPISDISKISSITVRNVEYDK